MERFPRFVSWSKGIRGSRQRGKETDGRGKNGTERADKKDDREKIKIVKKSGIKNREGEKREEWREEEL